MASIGGLSGGLNNTSSMRGYGGLASGLDRDTLIEQLTYATRNKIAKQQQNKQKLSWEQEAIRNLTNLTSEFSSKFTSYTSSSNLTSSNLFSRNQITALGENSKYISVSGKANTADSISILGVKQKAEDAKIMGGVASNGLLTSGSIKTDFDNSTVDANLLEGQSFLIKQGTTSYLVTLKSGEGYDYENQTADSINKSFAETEIGGKKLSELLKATTENGKLVFTNQDPGGNKLTITTGFGDILQNLGFLNADEEMPEGGLVIEQGGTPLTAKNETKVLERTKYTDYLAEKTLTFDYNGTSKTIEIGKELHSMEDLRKDLQAKLNSAFGKDRIKVKLDPNGSGDEAKLVFETTTPDGNPDKNSLLAITDGSDGLLGDKTSFFGITYGQANRVNMSETLTESGLVGNDTDPVEFKINGKTVNGITGKSTVEDIMKAINDDESLGVRISYLSNSDRFVLTSTEKGASGSIDIEYDAGTASGAAGEALAKKLFGATAVDAGVVQGKDAIISVKYAGDPNAVEITRDSNAFTVDGLNISLKDTFGYKEDLTDPNNPQLVFDPTTEAITFDAKVDTEATSKVVKEMIDSFNVILTLINKEAGQKPNRDYAPLTDEQREGMSEDQIEKWEAKAKEGLLFNDTDLRSFADSLRFTIPAASRKAFADMGITIATDYADNGKLVLNETKFKAALESDPDQVKELFTKEIKKDADGNVISGGLMSNISSVIQKYAGTTGTPKGAFIERAGSIHAPASISQNSIQKKMDEIDATVKSLKSKLKTEQDRYIKQFTTMETLISQMNSQSGYLSQLTGGGM